MWQTCSNSSFLDNLVFASVASVVAVCFVFPLACKRGETQTTFCGLRFPLYCFRTRSCSSTRTLPASTSRHTSSPCLVWLAFANHFRERTFAYWAFVFDHCFFGCCFAYVFALFCASIFSKVVWQIIILSGLFFGSSSLSLSSSPSSSSLVLFESDFFSFLSLSLSFLHEWLRK